MARSFRGKEVNMLALAKKHELSIALGNGPTVNTRGDLIGRNGKIIKTREEQIREYEESLKTQEGSVSMKNPNELTAIERTIAKYSSKPQKITPKKPVKVEESGNKKKKEEPVVETKPETKPEPKKEDITWDE